MCYRSVRNGTRPIRIGTGLVNPQRILRQKLEDLQRAGVTHVPSELADLAVVLAETVLSEAQEPDTAESAAGTATSPTLRIPAGNSKAETPATPASTPSSKPSPNKSPSTENLPVTKRTRASLSRDEREPKLTSLAARVAACQKCQELAETRTQTVFGVGNPEARILFIGEAPGADEDKQGEPFVGRAGKLLTDIITAMKLTREEIYICNILRCRPPGNRNPSATEAENCREFLDGQIETVAPEYIVCWGSVAAKNLLDTDTAIGRMRGKFYEYGSAKVLCTYHPSYLLRNPSAKKEVWKDMKFLMKDMGVNL